MRDFRIYDSSPPGDDGLQSISPVRGRLQAQWSHLRSRPSAAGSATHNWRTLVYLAGLLFAVALLMAALLNGHRDLGSLAIVLPLTVLAALAERGSVRLNQTLEVSISLLPTLFAAVVLGPVAAMVVGGGSMLGDFRRPYFKWAVYTCTRSINGAITGLVAAWVSSASSSEAGSVILATVAAVVVAQVLEVVFATTTLKVRGAGTLRGVVATYVPVLPSSIALYTAVVAPLALAYEELSPWSVLLFLLPALAAQRLFSMYQNQRQLVRDLASVNQSLERANLSFASALVTTLDARDRYTAGHSAAVAVYARDIAAGLGLTPETQRLAHLSGLLHDIGKIGVPPGVLEKNGPLTLPERRKMEEHSVVGERILANVEAYSEIALIVRHHHERVDGQGYPDGLTFSEIPQISRIICVADAYNAMTSDRPYREAMPVDVARARLIDSAGTQFDPDVVRTFDEILEAASETYSSGARADFALEAQSHPELSRAATAA